MRWLPVCVLLGVPAACAGAGERRAPVEQGAAPRPSVVVAAAPSAEPSAVASASSAPVPRAGPEVGLAPDLPAPSEGPPRDPRCTPITTAGRHLLRTLSGCLPCGGPDEPFTELTGAEFGSLDRNSIVRARCRSGEKRARSDCEMPFDVVGFEIARRASLARVPTHGVGVQWCGPGHGFFVATEQREDGRKLEQIARDVMSEWKVRGTVHVLVAPPLRGEPD